MTDRGADRGTDRGIGHGIDRVIDRRSSDGVNHASDSSKSDHGVDHGVVQAAPLHALLKSLSAAGNTVRLRFIDALRTLHDERLCYELGYASFHQYCDRELGLGRTTAYDYLRVAAALDGLPGLRAAYGNGELSWEQVRAITQVATVETEIEWIRLAWKLPVKQLLAEVSEARRQGRSAPRDRRHGLPNLTTRITIVVTLEEKARVDAAFTLVADALGQDEGAAAGAARVAAGSVGATAGAVGADEKQDPRPTLVRWADAVLAGAIPVTLARAGRAGRDGRDGGDGRDGSRDTKTTRPTPAQTILYQACPECRSASVVTSDGPVQVAPDRIDELAPVARRVDITAQDEQEAEPLPDGEIDAPNDARLARQVLARDGLFCGNPGCGHRKNLQAHHIVHRSAGGRTVLTNEVAVCATCHALLHAGLLDVRSTDRGLAWSPRPWTPAARLRDTNRLLGELAEQIRGHAAPTAPQSTAPQYTSQQPMIAQSTDVNSTGVGSQEMGSQEAGSRNADCGRFADDLAGVLVALGCPRRQAAGRVAEAVASLTAEGKPLRERTVLGRALAAR